MILTRRTFAAHIAGAVALAAPIRARAGDWREQLQNALAGVNPAGGRLGVGVLDTASGEMTGLRAEDRFPLCSTFKALLAAAVLKRADLGELALTDRIAITPADLLSYAPVTKAHVGADLTIAELCAAAVTVSDNSAANLLLKRIGGPGAVTEFARSLGDRITRLDRIEPDLNSAEPGDLRDTTTPAAMAETLARLATGDPLKPASRELWMEWLVGCQTGLSKLRAGLPPSWRVGDKTGSGERGTSNDVAIFWPPGRAPIVVVAYLTECSAPDPEKNGVHAAVGRAVAAAFG